MKKYILPGLIMLTVLVLILNVSAVVTTVSQQTYTNPHTGNSATVTKYQQSGSYVNGYGYNVQTSTGGYYTGWGLVDCNGNKYVAGSGVNAYGGAAAGGAVKTTTGYVAGGGAVRSPSGYGAIGGGIVKSPYYYHY